MSSPRVLVLRAAGVNCEVETVHAWELAGASAQVVHINALRENPRQLLDYQILTIPGGFSYGDDVSAGKILANQMEVFLGDQLRAFAERDRLILGICNGFQILTEAGFLPGVLMRNAGLKFVCRPVKLVIEESRSAFTRNYAAGEVVSFPVANGDGNYFADDETLERLEGEGRVAFRYAPGDNPNGSRNGIAGILNEKRNVLGLMPHPERVCESMPGSTGRTGGTDGRVLFQSLIDTLS